jgi:signal transduction histidine kinase
MLQHIREAGQSLLHLFDEFLDFSKIEAGHLPGKAQTFELASVLARIESSLGRLARENGLDLVVRDCRRLSGSLHGDPPSPGMGIGPSRRQRHQVYRTGQCIDPGFRAICRGRHPAAAVRVA